VVARVGEEVTVKRLHQENNIVTLFPENKDYSPIVVNLAEESMEIEGLYVGVIRQH
jgi:repressor LexA